MKKSLKALIVAAIGSVALITMGAVTPNSTINPQTPDVQVQNFVQGTDSALTYKTVFTPGANGSRLYAIFESNNDGSATHLVSCEIYVGSVAYVFTATTTASSDGFANATPAKNLLTTTTMPGLKVDSNGNSYLELSSSSDLVKCTFATALTSSTLINIIAVGADY
jgi:hypothetical protein